jgi:hypothetical protein
VRSNLSLKSTLSKAPDAYSTIGGEAGAPGNVTQEAWADIVKFNAQQYQLEQEEARRKKEEQK